jgi:preprotein translocase subunit SecD
MSRLLQVAVMLGVTMTGMTLPSQATAQDKRTKFEIFQAEIKPAPGLTETAKPGSNEKLYLPKSPSLTNEDVAEAKSGKDNNGSPVVEITFTKEGAKKMKELCENHLQKPMAILVDGKVICAPNIRAVISEKGIISLGNAEEVERIVKGMNGK